MVLDDFLLCIVDIETRKVVRKYHGHSNTITDVVCYDRYTITIGPGPNVMSTSQYLQTDRTISTNITSTANVEGKSVKLN